MPTKSPSPSAESPADRLQTAVDDFAANIRVLTDVVDQLTEDLSWLTRNGMPHQPVTVLVHRMPMVAAGGGERGSLGLSFVALPIHDPTADMHSEDQLRNAVIEHIVDRAHR